MVRIKQSLVCNTEERKKEKGHSIFISRTLLAYLAFECCRYSLKAKCLLARYTVTMQRAYANFKAWKSLESWKNTENTVSTFKRMR